MEVVESVIRQAFMPVPSGLTTPAPALPALRSTQPHMSGVQTVAGVLAGVVGPAW